MQIEDATALVAGGASGLGWATAEMLHARGGRVVIIDLPAARERVQSDGRFSFVAADVRDEQQVQAGVSRAASMGELRICVNTAGVASAMRVLRKGEPHPLDEFRRAVEVNLIGTFNVLRLAAAAMQRLQPRDGDRGVIVNTASVAAFDGQIGQASYAASKGGVAALTLPVARDLAATQIRCVTIAPGLFETPMLDGLPPVAREALEQSVPHPSRLGAPNEYAALVCHIVENPMLNGEVIRLDGALRMAPR
jgi:NAD(P)-dependent dehydrogenase (short-subunit alcohol dehydrogenase family)